jgi:hypothetical protein
MVASSENTSSSDDLESTRLNEQLNRLDMHSPLLPPVKPHTEPASNRGLSANAGVILVRIPHSHGSYAR